MSTAMVWKSLAVFFTSILPIVECKGAVVLARFLQVPHVLTIVLSAVGSYLPVLFLLYTKRGREIGLKQKKKKGIPEKFRKYLERYGSWALLVLIAIPFTGMGCWLGATLARIMHMDKNRAAIGIFIGNIIAVLVMNGCVHGIHTGIKLLL